VFDRIKANRRRAREIANAERRAVDQHMRANGYLIRSGPGLPRYVRPGWTGVLGSVRSRTDPSRRPGRFDQ
jgi:hypothetical protein